MGYLSGEARSRGLESRGLLRSAGRSRLMTRLVQRRRGRYLGVLDIAQLLQPCRPQLSLSAVS